MLDDSRNFVQNRNYFLENLSSYSENLRYNWFYQSSKILTKCSKRSLLVSNKGTRSRVLKGVCVLRNPFCLPQQSDRLQEHQKYYREASRTAWYWKNSCLSSSSSLHGGQIWGVNLLALKHIFASLSGPQLGHPQNSQPTPVNMHKYTELNQGIV